MSTQNLGTLGKYQLVREVAKSNDIVYEAIDPTIGRRVAVKELVIPTDLAGRHRRERLERFWREGKAAGRLSHPNVVSIFEVGKEGDRYFIAMEFLDGQNLREVLRARGHIPMQDAIDYTLQLCSALSYAHQNGVVHRDLKPENVQVLPGNQVKLTDFGIARLTGESNITQDGQVFGTPSYMSPEQVMGRPIDQRSDIFSLGVVLYEMLTARKPFVGDSIITITYNILNTQPSTPNGVPEYLRNVLDKALAKDPENRYASVDEMARDLQEKRVAPGALKSTVMAPMSSPFASQQPTVTGSQRATGQYAAASGAMVSDPFAISGGQNAAAAVDEVSVGPMIVQRPRWHMYAVAAVVLIGLIIFVVWAFNKAQHSISIARTEGAAMRHYEQGVKLQENGDTAGAESQWQLAIQASPESKYAKLADDQIFAQVVLKAKSASERNLWQEVYSLAGRLVDMHKSDPEGYFYLGIYYESAQKPDVAIANYEMAERFGGNDPYAIEARNRMMTLEQAMPAAPTPAPTPEPAPPASGNSLQVPTPAIRLGSQVGGSSIPSPNLAPQPTPTPAQPNLPAAPLSGNGIPFQPSD